MRPLLLAISDQEGRRRAVSQPHGGVDGSRNLLLRALASDGETLLVLRQHAVEKIKGP